MNSRVLLLSFAALGIFAGGFWAGSDRTALAASSRVYELRVYHTYPGKLDGLLARFRDHTMTIFERHGMKNVGYWTPIAEPEKGKTLYYIISHESRDAATENWKAFRDDPDWKKVREESEKDGMLLAKPPESVYMKPTDYSPLK